MQADTNDPRKKKIRTESGAWIPATYKTDLYEQWKKAHQIDHFENRGQESDEEPAGGSRSIHDVNKGLGAGRREFFPHAYLVCFIHAQISSNLASLLVKYQKSQGQERQTAQNKRRKFKSGTGQRELRSKEQIARVRGKKSELMSRQKHREKMNSNKRAETGRPSR